MKTTWIYFLVLVGMVMSMPVKSQKRIQEVKILTNMHCKSCKMKIENELTYTKGVKEVFADLSTKIVTVRFDTTLVKEHEIVGKIQKLGYQAFVLKSDAENLSNPPSFLDTGRHCKDKDHFDR